MASPIAIKIKSINNSLSNLNSRYALIDTISLQIMVSDRTSPQHGMRPDRYSGANQRLRPCPTAILQYDFSYHQVESRFLVIMVSTKQHRPLTNTHVTTNLHPGKIVNPYILANPRIITDLQQPRILHIHARLDIYSYANFRTKQSQHPHLETRNWQPRIFHHKYIDEVPQ